MTKRTPVTVDPMKCPLCQQSNHCINLACGDAEKACWCNNPDITFPAALLKQVPAELKRKACICQSCAEAHQQQTDQEKQSP